MADFPQFNYSKKQVLRAGEALKDNIIWSKEREEDIKEIFRIANSWRDSHAYPMNSIRHELIARLRNCGLKGSTVARLKRMSSIRRKLRTIPEKLNQIQDLGGCRVILPKMDGLNNLLDSIKYRSRHKIYGENDYINQPKKGGYRCHHIKFQFTGTGGTEVYDGRRIELQIRTQLQHSWATAVEAVGLLISQNLKAGEGNNDWLRLFELMSAELSLAENCPVPIGLPTRVERVQEIKELNNRLNAVNQLDNMRNVVRFTEIGRQYYEKPSYYRLEYDNKKGTVNVTPHFNPLSATEDYNKSEEEGNISGDDHINTVLVEAEEIKELKTAFPNYFGDVLLFNQNLANITQGGNARVYTVPPRELPARRPEEVIDPSWLRSQRHRRWT